MSYCFTCDLLRLRLACIPNLPGRWGKFLACVVAASWAATLWTDGPGIAELAGVRAVIALCGLHLAALWMTMVAVVPLVGMLTGCIPLRVFGATLGLVTWPSLLLEIVVQDGVVGPTMGGCMVGLLGCLNADFQLARLVATGYE
jgi:hypothetical protein